MEYEYNTLDADDVKFKHPFSMLISGGRRTGKTHFTKTLLLRNNEFITPKVDHIFWFYASYQPIAFDELKENVANLCEDYPKKIFWIRFKSTTDESSLS